jgi:hypothetical protein
MENPECVVEAQEVRIVDATGHIRIRLGMIGSDAKTPGIHLLRADGSAAMKVELEEARSWGQMIECPVIRLYDEDGILRLVLNVAGEPPYPGIELSGPEGKPGVTLVVPPNDGYGEISLSNGEGGTGWHMRGFDNKEN